MIKKYGKKLNESVINISNFSKIKLKVPCILKIFEKFPKYSFIVVLDDNGKVIIYERKNKITFNNLREVVSLFGSRFFKYPLSETGIGKPLIDFYEKESGLKIREIYMYDLSDIYKTKFINKKDEIQDE